MATVKARHLSFILGSMGFIGIYLGMLFPPTESGVRLGFESWSNVLSGILLITVVASPYLAYMVWVRRWTVAIGVGVAMFIATGVILYGIWHDEHSTAALGLFWLPIVLFPIAAFGWAIDRSVRNANPHPASRSGESS